jgi:hypothetical protein
MLEKIQCRKLSEVKQITQGLILEWGWIQLNRNVSFDNLFAPVQFALPVFLKEFFEASYLLPYLSCDINS